MTDLPPPEMYAPQPVEPREMLDWKPADLLYIEQTSGEAQRVRGYSADLMVGVDEWQFQVVPLHNGQWFTTSWFKFKMRMSWASDTPAEAMVWGQHWADGLLFTDEPG